MQFDAADGNGGKFKTNYETIKFKYVAAGYTMPNIVFWNLRAGTNDYPVTSNEVGAALVSGFSPSLLKILMEDGELEASKVISTTAVKPEPEKLTIDPFLVLRKAIDDERYNILQL